jgi:hypothetical protein
MLTINVWFGLGSSYSVDLMTMVVLVVVVVVVAFVVFVGLFSRPRTLSLFFAPNLSSLSFAKHHFPFGGSFATSPFSF